LRRRRATDGESFALVARPFSTCFGRSRRAAPSPMRYARPPRAISTPIAPEPARASAASRFCATRSRNHRAKCTVAARPRAVRPRRMAAV